MIILKSTTEILRVMTGSTADIDYSVSYADTTTTAFSPSTSEGKITTATTTTIVASPAASTQRQVKLVTISNVHASASNTIRVNKYDSTGPAAGYDYTTTVTLLAGETMQYMDGSGWIYYSTTGAIKGTQSAAGSTTQIQFNSNGILAGDPDFTWDAAANELGLTGTDTSILLQGTNNEPTAPAIGSAHIYTKAVVGKMQLKIKGPSGLDTPLQAAMWQNNTVWWQPGAAAGVYVGTVGANLGTAALVLPTTTNLYTMMRRSTFANVAISANQQVGIRTENMFARGDASGLGGFLFVCRFGLETWTAGDRLFVGLCAGTTAVVTVQPSTLADTAGFCIEASDTAITFLHNDGSGTGVKETIDNQPALASNNGYDAYIWCAPNGSTVYYRLDNVLTGATIVDTSISTELPVNTTMLTAQAVMSNGTNGSVGSATIGINRMYIETDR